MQGLYDVSFNSLRVVVSLEFETYGSSSMTANIIEMMAAAVFLFALTDFVDLVVKEGSQGTECMDTDTLRQRADRLKKIQYLVTLLATVPSIMLHLVWSIVGIVLCHRVTSKCSETGKADMAWTWCILTLVYVALTAYHIEKQRNLDPLFVTLSLSHKHHREVSSPKNGDNDSLDRDIAYETSFKSGHVPYWRGVVKE